MRLSKLTEKLNIEDTLNWSDVEIESICYDSRKAAKGALFVAIRGYESDGHRFIESAVNAGAAAVICEELPSGITCPCIRVNNSRLALAYISSAFYGYPAENMKIIGVTGTSGKTTSTHLIKHIIESSLGTKVGLIGTNGNMIGDELIHTEYTTPDSCEIQRLFREMADKGCTHVVMEVSSHSLVLDRVSGFTFDVAAFTNLSQDHLDFHLTMDAYAEAKSMLFRRCLSACINSDDAYSHIMRSAAEESGCRIITTSAEGNDADIIAKDIRLSASSVRFAAVYGESTELVRLGIPGGFSVCNALTAISVCISCGISLAQCAAALADAEGVKGRVELVRTNTDYSVIIDYSHKPDALEKVIRTLRPVTKGRLFALFGCGGDRDKAKRPIMGAVAAKGADVAIVTSDNPRTEDPLEIISEITAGIDFNKYNVKVIPDRIEAIHWAIDNASAGDVILLAGKGHEDYQVIGHTKIHMDEREIVSDYLKEKGVL